MWFDPIHSENLVLYLINLVYFLLYFLVVSHIVRKLLPHHIDQQQKQVTRTHTHTHKCREQSFCIKHNESKALTQAKLILLLWMSFKSIALIVRCYHIKARRRIPCIESIKIAVQQWRVQNYIHHRPSAYVKK